jgi:monothiol glutaredoxin
MSDDQDKVSLNITGSESPQESNAETDDVIEQIDREVTTNDVVLYMKGTPEDPMCGFSAKAAAIVSSYEVDFHSVNVLDEEDKREGIKEYGDWPTIPQLYIQGELVGGSDILSKMYESGELDEMFEEI